MNKHKNKSPITTTTYPKFDLTPDRHNKKRRKPTRKREGERGKDKEERTDNG